MHYDHLTLTLYRFIVDDFNGEKTRAVRALIDAAIEGRKVEVRLPAGLSDRSWYDCIPCQTFLNGDKALAFRAKAKEAGMGLSELARSCVEPVA